MEPKPHNISLPLALFLMTCASLIFFLPAAISMNAPSPAVGSEVLNSEQISYLPSTNGVDVQLTKNEKGSLSLKTAAIVGSSSAVAAAVLAGGANH